MDPNTEKDLTDESVKVEAPEKKPSSIKKLRDKFKTKVRLKVSLNSIKPSFLKKLFNSKKKKSEDGEEESEDTDKTQKKKKSKSKKEKPVKNKKDKNKKTNAKKSVEDSDSDDDEGAADDKDSGKKSSGKSAKKGGKSKKGGKGKGKGDESSGKSNPFLMIALIIGAMGVGGVSTAAVLYSIDQNKPETLMHKAAAYVQAEDYANAQATYEKVMSKGDKVDPPMLADAYLAVAEIFVTQETPEQAVTVLQEGLEKTADERISARLDELNAQIEQAKEAAKNPGAPPVVPAVPVVFSDPAFEKMIRMALKKADSEQIMDNELASVTSLKIMGGTDAVINELLESWNRLDSYTVKKQITNDKGETTTVENTYTERGGITSLADLVYFKKLTRLTIAYNKIQDISAIEGIASLETLGLYCNDISDIKPLSGLTNLKNLFLYNNKITDISPLSGLSSLEFLWMQENQISSLTPVSGLSSLTQLFIGNNQITDITPLRSLTKLHFLYADNNQISDISVLAGLTSLTDISFVGNPVGSYAPAAHVANINIPYASTHG